MSLKPTTGFGCLCHSRQSMDGRIRVVPYPPRMATRARQAGSPSALCSSLSRTMSDPAKKPFDEKTDFRTSTPNCSMSSSTPLKNAFLPTRGPEGATIQIRSPRAIFENPFSRPRGFKAGRPFSRRSG
jgi:hypothetical protein